MTSTDYRKRIKGGISGAYIFYGGEEFMKRFCLTETRRAISDDPATAAFNIVNITGSKYKSKKAARDDKDDAEISPEDTSDIATGFNADVARISEALQSPPMFSDKRLIEVHDLSFDKLTDAQIDMLCALTDDASDGTILILYCVDGEIGFGTPNRPTKLYTTLSKCYTPVLFEPETPTKLASWIQKHFTAAAIIASPAECYTLMNRCGHTMFILSGEIEKLISYIKSKGDNRLTPEYIEAVTCAYTETADFGLTNAIQAGDAAAAFRELGVMKLEREKPELILGMMTRFISDVYTVTTLSDAGMTRGQIASKLSMNEGRVAILQRGIKGKSSDKLSALLSDCLEADKKLKSTGTESYMLTDRLCAEIFS